MSNNMYKMINFIMHVFYQQLLFCREFLGLKLQHLIDYIILTFVEKVLFEFREKINKWEVNHFFEMHQLYEFKVRKLIPYEAHIFYIFHKQIKTQVK